MHDRRSNKMLSLIVLSMLFASLGSFIYLISSAAHLHQQATCPAEIQAETASLRGTVQ